MAVTLKSPFFISSRLLPAVRVANAVLSIGYGGDATTTGRTRYQYFIDFEGLSDFEGHDIKSGVGGGTLKQGMESLLAFLSACGESSRPGRKGENADLFPPAIGEWAYENLDEIGIVLFEVEETEGCCVEAR
jgi:hypothetical protein